MSYKKLFLIAGVAVLALLALSFLFPKAPVEAPETGISPGEALTITEELDSIDLGDLDSEFDAIDKDLNTL